MVAGLGGQTYKTLLDVHLLNSNFANLINRKRKRQRERPLVMTIASLRRRRGDYSISSLTWASYVAYLSGRQRRPEFGISKSKTPTSFFVSVRIREVAGHIRTPISHFMKRLLVTLVFSFVLGISVFAQQYNKYNDSYNYQRGTDAYFKENYSEALEYLNKEVEQHQDNAYAFTRIALIRYVHDEYGKALTAVNLALKATPKKDKEWKAYNLRIRSRIYKELEKYNEAIADLNSAASIAPKESSVYEDRAKLYYELENYTASDNDFLQMLKLNESDMLAKMGLGRNCIARKEYQKAIELFDEVSALYTDYSSAFSFRAEAYFGLKEYSSAASDIISALAIDGDNKAFYLLAKHAEDAYTELLTRLKAKAVIEPNNDYWPYCQGVLNESVKKYDLAIEAYKKSMAKEPSDVTAYRIANCYEELGDWTRAIEYTDKAIEIDPKDVDYKNMKANLYWFAGDLDAAIAEVSKCVEAEPESYFYYHRRGWFKEHNNDLDGALEDYTTSIVLQPKHAYSYMTRGRLYLTRGENEKANADFQKCVELDTIPNGDSCAEFALYYLGQKDKAIDYMNKMLEEDADVNYYDAVCLYSLMEDKEKALDYLKKAFESGFKNFNHMLRDLDLDFIRDTQEYKDLVAKYAAKQAESLEKQEVEGNYTEKVVEIPFTRANGVIKVKCTINELPLQFILDTGASTVSISSLEATFMYKNDYLTAKDVVGQSAFVDANGDISVGTIINLRKVSFGGLELTDVRASVVSNDKAPLLLGQTVLSRLGKVEIDYDRDVLKITQKNLVK